MDGQFDSPVTQNTSENITLKRKPSIGSTQSGYQRTINPQDRRMGSISTDLKKSTFNLLSRNFTSSRLESRQRLNSLKSCTYSVEELKTIRKSASNKLMKYKTNLIKTSTGRIEYMNKKGIFPPWVNQLREQSTIEVKFNSRKRLDFKEFVSQEIQEFAKKKQDSLFIGSFPSSPHDTQRIDQNQKKNMVSKLQKILVNSTIKPEKNKKSIELERAEKDPRQQGDRISWLANYGIKERIVPSFHRTMPLLKMTIKGKSD